VFLALELPSETRDALARWRDRALEGRRDLRPVAPEALHVTLVFLGYRPEKEIPAIAAAAFEPLRGIAAPLLSPLGIVPVPKRRPRLFALDLDDAEGRCVEVQAAASGSLEAGRFYTPEKREFWPHVTVARVKRDARAEPLPDGPSIEPFVAREVVLYRSHLSPRGARYEPLERITLA
jgi:2'-5' RNA ligase